MFTDHNPKALFGISLYPIPSNPALPKGLSKPRMFSAPSVVPGTRQEGKTA